jgi:hypothetical protein
MPIALTQLGSNIARQGLILLEDYLIVARDAAMKMDTFERYLV